MTIRYLDPSSPTNGTGTAISPYNILPTFQGVISSGDILRIKRGTTYTNLVMNTIEAGGSGTCFRNVSVSNFTIEAYANLDGSDDDSLPRPIITVSALSSATVASFINLTPAATGFKLRNIDFTNCDVGTLISGHSGGGGSILIKNVDISNCLYLDINKTPPVTQFILALGSSSVIANRVDFINVNINGVGCGGIFVRASPGILTNCSISNVAQTVTSNHGDCISMQNTSTPGFCTLIVNKCYLNHSSVGTKHVIISDSAGSGDSGVVYVYDSVLIGADHTKLKSGSESGGVNAIINSQGSVFAYRNTFIGGSYGIFCYDSANLPHSGGGVIEGNLFIMTEPAILVSTNSYVMVGTTVGASAGPATVVRNNTFICKNSSFSFQLTQSALDMNKSGAAVATDAKNNLFVGWGTAIRKTSGTSTESYNWAYDCTRFITNRASSDATLTPGTGDISGTNPKLLNNYMIADSSPLIAAGIFLGYGRRDKNNIQFNNPPSIGAYEYIKQRSTAIQRNSRM